jgi:hypothetical protein
MLYANERAPRLPITTRKKHMFARTAFYLNARAHDAWYVFVRGVLPGPKEIFCTFMRQIFICRSDSPMSAFLSAGIVSAGQQFEI